MRGKTIFLCALLCLVGVTHCQDDSDDSLTDFLKNYGKQEITTTKADDGLNLDPDTDDTVGGRSDNGSPDPEVTECKTENGEQGVCVTYYLCELGTKTIIEDGNTLIDARAIEQCPKVLDTCCLRNQVATSKPSPEPSKPSIEADGNANHDVSSPEIETLPGKGSSKPPTAASTAAGGNCGYTNPGGVFTIREGSSPSDRVYADFGEFPWMVALLKRSNDEEWKSANYIGGGSLIHPLVVMTTAHKVKNLKANQIKIRAGEYETNSEEELYDHQERNVAKIVVHQQYFGRSLYNDIALLFLEAPVDLEEAPHIGIGCLTPQLPPPGTQCFSMGWGAADFANKKIFASMLKKVKVPLVAKSKCEKDLRKTYLGNIFRLHKSLVCAGGEEGIDTCRGDGGSPLVCALDAKGSRFGIYGMVAYGIGCGGKDIPGVYVNVPNLYEWVGQQLALEGIDSKSYTVA